MQFSQKYAIAIDDGISSLEDQQHMRCINVLTNPLLTSNAKPSEASKAEASANLENENKMLKEKQKKADEVLADFKVCAESRFR
jgi:hypothetical protein